MAKKNLLVGIGLGVVGSLFYSSIKEKLKPMAVKALEGAFILGDNTKEFMDEVTEEAKRKREDKYKAIVEQNTVIESAQLKKQQKAILEQIKKLRKELEEMSKKDNSA